jgi:hypothetical protein
VPFLALGKALGLSSPYFHARYGSTDADYPKWVQPAKDAICTLYGDPPLCE